MKGEVVNGAQEAEALCRDCQRFDERKYFCRKLQISRHPSMNCPEFEMKLADHYVPNIWDQWKKQAEKRSLG